MSRDLVAALNTELAKRQLRPVFFVEVETMEGSPAAAAFVRMWTGSGDKVWDSKTWIGALVPTANGLAGIGAISPITETRQVRAEGVRLTLLYIPIADFEEAIGAVRVGLPARIWFGALSDSEAVIADPYLCFSGRVDAISWTMGRDTGSITLNVESDLLRLQIPNETRMTNAEQQRLFPGDTGFQYVEVQEDRQLLWGIATPTPLGSVGSAPGPSRLYNSFFGSP